VPPELLDALRACLALGMLGPRGETLHLAVAFPPREEQLAARRRVLAALLEACGPMSLFLVEADEAIAVTAATDLAALEDAELHVGAEIALGPGRTLRLQGLPYWVQLRGSHDPSKPLFFAGVVIGIAGVVLLFGFTRVETGVFVEGGQLVVALRSQRFAPLYAERFEALCKEWIA